MIRLRRSSRGSVATAPVPVPEGIRLAGVAIGATVTITAILGDECFRGRLLGLGVVPGAAASVAGGGGGRPLVLSLGGTRLALDPASAHRVVVREGGPSDARGRVA